MSVKTGATTFFICVLLTACHNQSVHRISDIPLPTADVAAPTLASEVIPNTESLRFAANTSTQKPLQVSAIPHATPVPVDLNTPERDIWAELDQEEAEELLTTAINDVRTAHGLPPYTVSPDLSAAARLHSCDMAANAMISHTSSDGRTLTQRLSGSELPWVWPSENIAVSFADAQTVVAFWMDEPPDGWHRVNILDLEQDAVGTGYCYRSDDPSGNYHYWTADFARLGEEEEGNS
ncbi:MAG: CAP domain-containing protein [Chloroflexota bacterium]